MGWNTMPLNRHARMCCTDFVGHSVTDATILAVENKKYPS